MVPASAAAAADQEIAAAIARFFHGGTGPSHAAISRVFTENGYSDQYIYQPGMQGPPKEARVLGAFTTARRNPTRARSLLNGMLGLLRLEGLIGSGTEPSQDEIRLKRALARQGWLLTGSGELQGLGSVDLETGGREALDEQLTRLRRATDDPALLIGTAKDLLESVAKFVLEEHGFPVSSKMDFGGLWHLARERLGVLPQQVDTAIPGYEAVQAIHQSTWQIAQQVNTLRNLQGTGHGRTLPTGITEELAFLVVREACTVAEYFLALLDKSHGR